MLYVISSESKSFITLILEFGNLNKDYLEKVFAHVSESLNIIDTQYSTI